MTERCERISLLQLTAQNRTEEQLQFQIDIHAINISEHVIGLNEFHSMGIFGVKSFIQKEESTGNLSYK